MPGYSRRAFITGAAAFAAAAWLPRRAAAQGAKTKLILLGTGGGPRPRKASSAPAQVIVSNDVAYVIDLRQRCRPPARFRRRAADPAAARLHHPPPFGPQRRLRQFALVGVDRRAANAGRHVGASASRENDQAVLRDERV